MKRARVYRDRLATKEVAVWAPLGELLGWGAPMPRRSKKGFSLANLFQRQVARARQSRVNLPYSTIT